MNRILMAVAAAVLLAFVVRAETPEDAYIRIYTLIQQADAAQSSNDPAGALTNYIDAQVALEKLQRVEPNWNTNVVGFRLRYLAGRIERLRATTPPPAVPPKSAPPPVGSVQVPAPAPVPAPDNQLTQIRAMEQQIQRLQQETVLLTAKLKEALAIQPATVDPRELAKTEEQLKASTREIETLKAALDAEKARPPSVPDNTQIEQLKKALAESNRRLTEQILAGDQLSQEKAVLQRRVGELAGDADALAALRAENELLKKQAVELSRRPTTDKVDELNLQLQQSQVQLARLQSDLEVSHVEKVTLEKRVTELQAQSAPDRQAELIRITQLEQERAVLARERDTAREQLTNVVTELASLRAKPAPVPPPPPAADARLEARLRALELEREQLNRRLASAQSALVANATASPSDSKKVRQLTQERDKLRKEVEAAQTELANRKLGRDEDAELVRQLQSERDAAVKQKDNLQTQLEAALADLKLERTKPAAPNKADQERIWSLTQERDFLKQQLTSALQANTNAADRDASVRITAMADQLAGLRARLDAYEAKAIPYTPDELALFKKTAPGVASFDLAASLSTTDLAEPNLAAGPAAPPRQPSREVPTSARELVVEGQRAFAAKQYDDAKQKYLGALRLDERSVFVLANLGAIELELNRLPDAETHLERAAALDPHDAFSLTVLGYLRFQQQRFDDAVEVLSRATKADPKRADAQNYLGIALSRKGLRGPAEAALRRAITIEPGYGSAHNNLAVVYIAQKPPMVELARWHYEKALAAGQPRDPGLERMLEANGAVVPK